MDHSMEYLGNRTAHGNIDGLFGFNSLGQEYGV